MEEPPRRPPGRLRKLGRGLAISLCVLALLEGSSSLFVMGYDLCFNAQRPLAERQHAHYDPELGWINARSISVPDLYSDGVGLSTNSMGMRGQREYAPAPPAGKLRVLCNGDSFTLGYGVDDQDAWPAMLEHLDPRLECPNMGQGGYGIDQAWLWYKRDGLALRHQVQVFAFIADDFRRVQRAVFLGYSKPVLALRAGSEPHALYVTNAPLPKASLRLPWLTQNIKIFEGLRTFGLGTRVRRKLFGEPSRPAEMNDSEALEIARAILLDLERVHRERASRLILLHLPCKARDTLGGLTRIETWALTACQESAARGNELIDLYDDFAAIPPAERERLFIQTGAIEFPGASGHYSTEGNAFVAERLLARLRALPEYEALARPPR